MARKPKTKTAAAAKKTAKQKPAKPKRAAAKKKTSARRQPAARKAWAESTAVKERILEEVQNRYSKAYRNKFRSLVMISGGVESVALLANLLRWTKGPVHAHFILTVNRENRHEVESMATGNAVAYCRETIRDFTFSASEYKMMLGLGGGLDLTLQMFMASRVNTATGGIFDALWTGHNAVPWDQMAEGSAVFAAMHVNRRFKPSWITPLRGLKKTDIYRSMPRDLANLTWSCRTPVIEDETYKPCGTCHSCKSMQRVQADLGVAPA